jgi:ammonium transporter, Amt family
MFRNLLPFTLAACSLLAIFAVASPAYPQETKSETKTETPALTLESLDAKIGEQTSAVDSKATAAALAGHNSWMLTSSALVLFMTAPGLAMFYSGLVRKKNVLGVMMQCVFLMGLNTVIWALYGYSLAFGGTNAYIGNLDYLFMRGVEPQMVDVVGKDGKPELDESGHPKKEIKMPMCSDAGVVSETPIMTHMLFQGMFFIITPALICGAFAERMKFSTMVVFTALWGTLVYCPLCHWVWDGGILGFIPLANNGKGNGILGGALDFAGGTVVHISSGVSALVCALVMGKRLGYGSEPMPPHNLTYTVLGAAMLWVGWFGFNAGSELGSDRLTTTAFCVTHFAAAAGALAWAGMEWITRGKPSVLGAASGLVAGLVCITPASGFVQPMPALLMGQLRELSAFSLAPSSRQRSDTTTRSTLSAFTALAAHWEPFLREFLPRCTFAIRRWSAIMSRSASSTAVPRSCSASSWLSSSPGSSPAWSRLRSSRSSTSRWAYALRKMKSCKGSTSASMAKRATSLSRRRVN